MRQIDQSMYKIEERCCLINCSSYISEMKGLETGERLMEWGKHLQEKRKLLENEFNQTNLIRKSG